MIKKVYWSYKRYLLFMSDFNETCISSTLSRNIQILSFMKTCPVELSGSMLMDGQTVLLECELTRTCLVSIFYIHNLRDYQ